MDLWDEAQRTHILARGNEKVNAELEAHQASIQHKPAPDAPIEAKAAFVRAKYEACAFKADGNGEIEAAAAASAHFAAKGQVHAGIVVIQVIAGHDLVNVDGHVFDGVSDPFVVVTTRDGKSAKTKIVMNDLNPKWGETLMLNVDDPAVPLQLNVFDHDDLTADDPMGDALIPLDGLAPGVPTKMTLALANVPKKGKGAIDVEATYTPLDA
eukprot:FR742096.1.p1 GENE.FR742096.1~~FR742096.1.p1  ORF type:complete len:219 (+),score=38.14 FR742096.1:25-657(+)